MTSFSHRLADAADLDAIAALIGRAMGALLDPFLDPSQVAASRAIMGLDGQLVADRTYFLVEAGPTLVGCGGWSRRATLYGGDHSADLRDATLLDPAREPARIRAMYTDPAWTRRGIGRLILRLSEAAARDAGFARVELMATLPGEPLYRADGYVPLERVENIVEGVAVPLIRMGKPLPPAARRVR